MLHNAPKGPDDKPGVAPLVLRLTKPRCVVGLAHASWLTEVYVATTGVDLRPFVEQRIRIAGDAVGGTTDLGGPAVVILTKEVERVLPAADER